MRKVSSLKTNSIFRFAIFTLPFENFIFAPSYGWATITPIILLVYVLLNIKNINRSFLKSRNILLFFSIGVIITILNFLLSAAHPLNFINAMISIMFGLIVFFSIDIFYENNKENLPTELKKITKTLLISYTISIMID